MSEANRSKSDVRQFQESSTTDFGFVCRNNRAVCAILCENVICRTSSIKHHFKTKHKKLFKDDSENNEALKKEISRYEKQSSIFKKAIRNTNQTMESSYKVAKCIAKREKLSTDGDFIKELFINCSEVLFENLPNRNVILPRIKNLPVSARTVERRVEDMAADVKMQQAVALQSVNTFSVALNITTDNAAAMVERDRGFVALIEEKIGHPIMKFQCIIHQESLCTMIHNLNLPNVIATTTKIVNFIVAHSATTHRQFRSFFDEMKSAHRDLPLHCTSRWLSCG